MCKKNVKTQNLDEFWPEGIICLQTVGWAFHQWPYRWHAWWLLQPGLLPTHPTRENSKDLPPKMKHMRVINNRMGVTRGRWARFASWTASRYVLPATPLIQGICCSHFSSPQHLSQHSKQRCRSRALRKHCYLLSFWGTSQKKKKYFLVYLLFIKKPWKPSLYGWDQLHFAPSQEAEGMRTASPTHRFHGKWLISREMT